MLDRMILAATPLPATPPPAIISFQDLESATRLERSRHKVDFFRLANHFETQTNKAFCGPTSAVIVLNALRADDGRIEKPTDPMLIPADARALIPPGMEIVFHRYTQNDFFDAKTEAVKTRAEVFGKPKNGRPDPGLQLAQLGAMLAADGLDVQVRVADEKLGDEAMRKELVENLGNGGDYVIVNFFRPSLGQEGGGHISPLGAYDEPSDSFLVLDVNANGHSWVWVPAARLFAAMRTKDTVQNRGYLLVKEGASGAVSPRPR